MDRFEHRRTHLMEEMTDGSFALIPAHVETVRNSDVNHPFRQGSDFFFLTGFPEPDAVALLDPGHEDERYVLFVRSRDPEQEAWTGRRAGVDGAREHYGADAAYPIGDLDEVLRDRLRGRDAVYYRLDDPANDGKVKAALAAARGYRARAGIPVVTEIRDPSSILHEMRVIKSQQEIDAMRRACEITAAGHAEAMRFARPGMNESEVQAALEFVFRSHGSERDGYESIVASGANAVILHYVENDREMGDGDLLLIDAGAEFDHLSADVTRTFPVNGTFTTAQRALYDLVLTAQRSALAVCRPGVPYSKVHETAVRVLTEGMVDLRLIPGPVDDAVAMGWYRPFYFHGTGHWLGTDVHDAGDYFIDGVGRPLEPGMVLTVEPGIYLDDEKAQVELYRLRYDESEMRDLAYVKGAAAAKAELESRRDKAVKLTHPVPPEFLGIGVRIEDDLLITTTGHEVLSDGVPTDPDDIEALCAEAPVLPRLKA